MGKCILLHLKYASAGVGSGGAWRGAVASFFEYVRLGNNRERYFRSFHPTALICMRVVAASSPVRADSRGGTC